MMNSTSAKVILSQDILFQEIEDEAVMLNLATEQYYGLNDVGKHMWRLLSQHGDVTKVLAELQCYYDTDKETLARDLMALVDGLQEAGLLRVEANAE